VALLGQDAKAAPVNVDDCSAGSPVRRPVDVKFVVFVGAIQHVLSSFYLPGIVRDDSVDKSESVCAPEQGLNGEARHRTFHRQWDEGRLELSGCAEFHGSLA
jgi:hypothetical protein